MKKIFTLLTMALLAIGAQAQTATDSYLDIANYATLDNIDFKNCTKLYSYDSEKKVLVLSAYAAYQSSVTGHGDDGLTGLAFLTYTAAGSSNVEGGWTATSDFNGSSYYGLLSSGNASDRAAAIKSANAYTFKVTGCAKVSILGKCGKKTERQVILKVSEGSTLVGEKSDDTNAIVELSVDDLDVTKTYDITVTGNSSSNGHFYEIAFYQTSSTEPETPPADPHAATVWDFTTTTADLLNPDNWSADAETEGRYTYGTEIASDTFVDLGEIGCSNGLGLKVARIGGKLAENAIRVDVGKQIQINASNAAYKIEDLAEGDKVRIRYKNASKTEARTFTVTNGDVTELTAPKTEDDNTEKEATITVAADGALVLTQSKAINVYAIAINVDLPEDTTGIGAIKAETATDAPVYNLSGQRVDENYRGVVIKNGKKMIK